MRDRLVVNNVTIERNQGHAGVYVVSGAGDIWLNETTIADNWGDGINVTMAGGGTVVNGTLIRGNHMRGLFTLGA